MSEFRVGFRDYLDHSQGLAGDKLLCHQVAIARRKGASGELTVPLESPQDFMQLAKNIKLKCKHWGFYWAYLFVLALYVVRNIMLHYI